MSSIPGFTLEDYIAWNYDLVIDGMQDVNFSLSAAEMLGTIPSRRTMTKSEFREFVQQFEPFRDSVEMWLTDFDSETQSWRSYSHGSPIDNFPELPMKL